MIKVNYEKIRKDNIEEYGKGTRHLSYFADIYSTRTHFIFEVLQNAEDALARRSQSPQISLPGYVSFRLHHDRLEINHNGKPFDERDIAGICGIGEGTKAGDYTQIGKFGIGFKSVYAYSFFPQIHSENEHFEIRRFVEPYQIEAPASRETLIVLPFDQPEKRPEWAFRDNVNADIAEAEISQAISQLNIRTLLFLRHIEKIEWVLPNGEQGFLSKKTKQENIKQHWRIVEVVDHHGKHEQWHIFDRIITVNDGNKEQQASVEVAFLLDQNGKVIKASDTELVISFPTEKKTELSFLIQAPFKATKSRDNIKSNDPANHQMILTAAQLAADSLAVLRDTDRLIVASYNVLPLDEDNFPEKNFFRPVYEQMREALKTQPILPVHGGGYAKADEAKLARGKDLVDLFLPKQLEALFGQKKIVWLDASITRDAFPEFHSYLRDLVDRVEVTPESLAPKLTADYLGNQPLAWLIRFIQYAEEGAKVLRSVPFIRLQSGEQVALPESSNITPIAWFKPDEIEGLDVSTFPLVHTELAENEAVRKFLEKEGVREIDAVDMVIKSILPKYKGTSEFNPSDYLNDLCQIAKAYTGDDEIKKKLENQLKNVPWLASVQAGNEVGDEVFWKQPRLFGDLFARPEELELTFSELEDSKIYFLHPFFENQFDRFPSFKRYLNEKCVRNLDAAAIVEKVILPKYKDVNKPFDESEYRKDLKWIVKARHVSDLKKIPWLACIHANGNMPDKIFWKKPNACESDKPIFYSGINYGEYRKSEQNYKDWCLESNIFERNTDHETWFPDLENIGAYFLHPCVTEAFSDDFVKKLVNPINKLFKKRLPDSKGHIDIVSNRGDHRRGLEGFDPDWEIIGLEKRMTSDPKIEHSVILWNLLKQNYDCIKGKIQSSSRQYYEHSRTEEQLSKIGVFLSDLYWLPDSVGNLHKPSELLLVDLPADFDTSSVGAKEVAARLGMKKPEIEKAADELSKGNLRKKELLELIANASDDELERFEKLVPKAIPTQPIRSFKEELGNLHRPQRGSISENETNHSIFPLNNPERYQNKVNQAVEEKVALHQNTPQTVRFSIVRESPSNQEARSFLYQQYYGKCQITGNTFPKASANSNGASEYYFEACSLVSYINADYLNDAGNMLCVSADTMAKLRNASFEWLDDLEAIIESFKTRKPGEIENVKVKIKLAEEEYEIVWNERHFIRLVSLYEKL
jgi:hypothetical protein